jgi:dihydrofolate reductase
LWPKQTDNPFTPVLDAATKYVVSSEPLDWQNSTLLKGEAGETVPALQRETDANLTVLGSGELVQDLAANGLIDEYLLVIAPIVLGKGRTLFRPGAAARLKLVDVQPTSTGVLIARYQPS